LCPTRLPLRGTSGQANQDTDNVPIRFAKFTSNWELSTARALSVVKFIIDRYSFSPDQLQAMGYGEYKPIVPNDSPENKAKNRRVEIKLVKIKKAGDYSAPDTSR
jgi:chemotaxis protein MotB